MIQIPLEIGDTILAGRFKNKKIKVNEIGIDDFGSPTINGRSILKIRIPKLYQKQENEMKTSIKENLSPDKLKTIDKKIAWGTEKTLPFSQGSAIKEVIQRYKIPAIKWGYAGTGKFIGVETNKQKMFWRDKGSELQFLGILNKDGSVAENNTLKEGKAVFVKDRNLPSVLKDSGLSFVEYKEYEDLLLSKTVPELRKLQGLVSSQQDKLRKDNPDPNKWPEHIKRADKQLRFRDMMLMAAVDHVAFKENRNIKEAVNPFQKSPLEVKIKQTDGSWHIYLQTVDGEECLTMTGWGTKEQAEHAAMMKGYSFDANKSNETPTRDAPKYTGYEKVRSEKPEEMKLSKEKTIEIKLESMMREILSKKKALNEADLSATVKEQLRNLKQLQQQIAEAKAQVDAVMKSTGLKDLEKSADKLLKEELWDFFNELKKDEQRLVDLGDIIMTVVKFQSEPATYEYEKTLDYALTQVNQDVKEKVLMQLKASEKIGKTKGSVSFATKTEAAGNSIWSSITNFLGKFIPALKRKGQKIDTELTKLKGLVAKIKK